MICKDMKLSGLIRNIEHNKKALFERVLLLVLAYCYLQVAHVFGIPFIQGSLVVGGIAYGDNIERNK